MVYLPDKRLVAEMGSFRSTRVVRLRLAAALCRFDLAVSAISIRRRIASEREGLSFWW
jgi:hypothetical protein